MLSVRCDCEFHIKSRPLTLSEDAPDLATISSILFLFDLKEVCLRACDAVDSSRLKQRARYHQNIKESYVRVPEKNTSISWPWPTRGRILRSCTPWNGKRQEDRLAFGSGISIHSRQIRGSTSSGNEDGILCDTQTTRKSKI